MTDKQLRSWQKKYRNSLVKAKAILAKYASWNRGPDSSGDWRCPHGFKSCKRCREAYIDFHDPTPAIEFLRKLTERNQK